MGKKTYINTLTSRLLDDENFNSSTDLAMQRYILEQRATMRPSLKSSGLGSYLTDAISSSMPLKFKKLFNFAKSKDNYYYGNPKSSITTSEISDVKQAVISYLNGLEGKAINVIYNKINSKNLYHYAWKSLYDDMGYNGKTNEIKYLSIREGFKCYLVSTQLVLSQRTYNDKALENNLDDWGNPINLEAEQAQVLIGESDKLLVTYTYNNDLEDVVKTTELSVSHVNPEIVDIVPMDNEYVQVMYEVDNTTKLFTYEYGSGELVSIDKATSYQEEFGSYYPRIYLREDGNDLRNMSKNNRKRVTTERLLKKLGMDLGTFTESLYSSIDDLNKYYKYIFVSLTISINKDMDDLITGEYLYNYFDALYSKAEETNINKRVSPILPNEHVGISQLVSDNTYTQKVNYWKSGKEVVTGVATNNKNVPLKVNEHCVKHEMVSGISAHKLYKQINAAQYILITVFNLEMKHEWSSHSEKESGSDEGLTIPLDVSVVNQSSPLERELLINKGLQLTIITKQVVKTKWYQSGVFKVVLAAISIAINLFVPGAGIGVMAVLQAVAVTIVTSIAVKLAVGLLVNLAVSLGVSPEFLAVITAVVVIAGAVLAGGRLDFSKMLNSKELLNALNQSANVYNKAIQNKISTIRSKMDDFTKYADSKYEKLKDAQALLDTRVIPLELELLAEPFNISDIYIGETVNEFHARTKSIDVVDASINMVEYYWEMTTSVPIKPMKLDTSKFDIDDVLLIT